MSENQFLVAKRAHGYKLQLGNFHRYTGVQQKWQSKQKHTSIKKKIRDIERLLTKEGMPAEIIEAKKADLAELKTKQKYKKNALRKSEQYRTIRLNEK